MMKFKKIFDEVVSSKLFLLSMVIMMCIGIILTFVIASKLDNNAKGAVHVKVVEPTRKKLSVGYMGDSEYKECVTQSACKARCFINLRECMYGQHDEYLLGLCNSRYNLCLKYINDQIETQVFINSRAQ